MLTAYPQIMLTRYDFPCIDTLLHPRLVNGIESLKGGKLSDFLGDLSVDDIFRIDIVE